MVKVKVLLGWMDEAEAMNTLLLENLTEPPLTEAEARALWEKYRERVAALPPRACRPPVRLTHCTRKEEYEVRYCIQKHRHLEQFREVVKLEDPGKLVVHQLAVTIPESEKYLRDMQEPDKRGTHRAYASMCGVNAGERALSLFAVLESDAVDNFFSAAPTVPAPFKRDMVCGTKPPLLSDFFDPYLCLELPQRKRRMSLRVDLGTWRWYRDWADCD